MLSVKRIIKKITIAIFVVGIVFLGLVGLDKWLFPEKIIVPCESHIINVPEIQLFIVGRTGFRGIRWNLDNNYIIFAFPTTFKTAESYFAAIHESAKSEGWKLTNSSIYQHIYQKIIKNATSSKIKFYSKLIVVLSYNLNKSEVLLELVEL